MHRDDEHNMRKTSSEGLVDPGADPRTRLVQAGLEAFGLYNFEGASTRELARLAGVNLSAIPYYFGGKKALYEAVVEHIAANLREKAGPVMESGMRLLDRADATDGELTAALQNFLEQIAAAMLLTPEARYWARIMLREQMLPTDAYDIIYERALGPALTVLTGLTARISGRPGDDPESGIRAFTLLGHVLIFRAAQETVKRKMDWRRIDNESFELIRNVIRENISAIMRYARTSGNGERR